MSWCIAKRGPLYAAFFNPLMLLVSKNIKPCLIRVASNNLTLGWRWILSLFDQVLLSFYFSNELENNKNYYI
jgi:hypothetical protein